MWKTIEGFSNYKVNEKGTVTSYKRKNTPKILKGDIDKDGYVIYSMIDDSGDRKAYKGHRIVANTYISNPESLPIVNHIDGDKKNNTIDNLEWVNNSENIQHAWDTGLIKSPPFGIEIYDTIKNKVVSYFNGYDKLAEVLGLSKASLYDIVYNKKLVYGAFRITVDNKKDYSENELFEKPFINRTINGKFKPYKWNDIVFENTKSFEAYTRLNSRRFRKALAEGLLDGKVIERISHYEYVAS